MAEKKNRYKKLPGRPFSMFGVRRLYQGPDHLLWVETIMGQEHYRRFYFKDIQAIILQRTRGHLFWGVAWTVLAVLFAIVTLAASEPAYASGFLAIFFLISLGLNLISGPSCKVYLQTAVQLQQISLGRLNKSRRVADRLKEHIEREQGALDVSTAPSTLANPFPTPGALHAIQPDQAHVPAGRTVEPAEPLNPLFHVLLFSVLIAAGADRILQHAAGWLALGFVDLFLVSAGLVLAAVALVRGYRQIRGSWLGHSTWTALIFIILHGLTFYVYYIVIVIQNPDLSMNHWELIKRFIETLMGSHPATLGIQLGSAAISLILGVSGLLALRRR